jgi:hypothetical protein
LDANKRKNSFKSELGSVTTSLASLAPYKQLFFEKNVGKLLSKEATTDLFGHVEELDKAANAALQALLFVSAMLVSFIFFILTIDVFVLSII